MKRFIFIIMLAISLLSCIKNKENHNIEMARLSSLKPSFTQSELFQNLQAYNDSIFNANLYTKLTPSGRNAIVASADVIGLMNGWSDGSNIGFWAGWFLGNPAAGKIIGGVLGGAAVAIAYSVLVYKNTTISEIKTVDEMYEDAMNSIILSGQLDCINIKSDGTISFDLIQNDSLLPVVLPENNNEAIFIGQSHNKSIHIMLEQELYTKNIIQTDKIDKMDEIDERVLNILYSNEIKEVFTENYNYCVNNIENLSTESLMQLDKTGIGGRIVNLYLQLHDSYVMDTEDSIEITNQYIQIINDSNELTNEEKKLVISALTLASYSTDLWTNL